MLKKALYGLKQASRAWHSRIDGYLQSEFEVNGNESHVCMLKKALYGLKQASRAMHSRIDGYLQSMGFTESEANPNLHYIFVGTDLLFLVLYVDDLFLIGAKKLIARCKADMAPEFEMKYINMMHYFLDLEVW
jgi:hypothetical protein